MVIVEVPFLTRAVATGTGIYGSRYSLSGAADVACSKIKPLVEHMEINLPQGNTPDRKEDPEEGQNEFTRIFIESFRKDLRNDDFRFSPEAFETSNFNDNLFNQQITLNMPGAFKSDNMDVDQDYYEMYPEVYASNPMNPAFDTQRDQNMIERVSLNEKTDPNFSERVQEFNPTISDASDPLTNFTHMTPEDFSITPDTHETNSIAPSEALHHTSSFLLVNEINPTSFHVRNGSIESHEPSGLSHQFYPMAELSPLTTTTSLTPSVNSIHSTQPSFFSANQVFQRNSLDNSHARSSFDFYKHRPSIDSQSSTHLNPQPRNQRYASFTNSISNYIPFMSDKNRTMLQQQRTEVTTPPKHSIRSIFKTNRNEYELFMDGIPENELVVTSPKDELEDPLDAPHKTKRSKKSLFTRFKTPVKQDEEKEEKPENDSESLEFTAYPLAPSTLNSSVTQEPDYAALFEKVAKRKMNTKKSKKAKNESSEFINSNSTLEKTSVDDRSSFSASSSNTSSYNAPENQGTIANASKRILGSRLISKKRSQQKKQQEEEEFEEEEEEEEGVPVENPDCVATIINKGVEIEVGLKALDLPPTTRVYPAHVTNSKSRIRGRKENKEADLSDTTKIYLCNYCSRRFKRQEHLKRHFRSLHTFEKPYDCSICNKKFSRSDNLNQHLKIHKQEGEME